jgi:hypothetical protein
MDYLDKIEELALKLPLGKEDPRIKIVLKAIPRAQKAVETAIMKVLVEDIKNHG